MTRPKRLLAIAGGVIVFVLLLLLALPLLFRDRIAQRVKTEVNQSVNARVDWRDVDLGFFRNFPNLTLTLDDLTAVGVGRFQADTLAAIRHFGVVLDLGSVLGNVMGGGKPVVVRSIELDGPRLSLIKLEDGTANWDIAKDTAKAQAAPEESKPVAVSLRRFEIRDAAVAFDNRQAGLKASLAGYQQSLSGDFQRDIVAVQTRAHADSVSVTFAGIPISTGSDSTSRPTPRPTWRRSSTRSRTPSSSSTTCSSASRARRPRRTTAIGLDLTFGAPSTDFRHILSLVPAIYAHDFQSVQTSGAIAVSGKVKGEYGDSAFPSFALNAKVDNGAFKYRDLPLPARDIFMDLSIANPGGDADSTVVRLQRFHVRMGRDPIDATMVLRTPVSDPDVDLHVTGKLDLADVRRTMKLEGIDELAGTVAADATVRTRMSYIDTKQYGKVAARGTLDIGNLSVKGAGLPQPLAIQQASLSLAPERAELKSFKGSVGSSDLQASGSLENLLGFVAQGRRSPGQRDTPKQPVQPGRVALGRG